MKKHLYWGLGLLLLGFIACEPASERQAPSHNSSSEPEASIVSTQSAEAYNDKLVRLQADALTDLLILSDVLDSSDPEAMWDAHAHYLETAHRVVAEAEALPPYQGDTVLRDAAVELFKFYAEAGENEYRRMVEMMLQPDLGEGDVKEWEAINSSLMDRETELDSQFAHLQEAFAQRHGLVLLPNTMEEHLSPAEEGSHKP